MSLLLAKIASTIMHITNLKLKNYRNYNEINIDFDPGVNIIYGNNAEGKTNLLESIYLCSTSKSHRNCKEIEIINFKENESHIKLLLQRETNKKHIIDIQLNRKIKKGIALDGLKIDKLSEFLGTFNVIMFAPEDLNIIKDGPVVRRKFLDMELCQIDKIYVSSLSNYNKILNQRNVLLKDIHNANGTNKKDLIDLIDSYDEQLIKYGIEIINKRKQNIEDLKNKIFNIHKNISDQKEELIIDYENFIEANQGVGASFASPEIIIKKYKELLIKNRDIDIKNQFTSIGPHRDDISFTIEGKDIRKFGSQGQKKTAAISLKLSELQLIKEKIKNTPVLLLDDVFSELDETRQKLLVKNLKDIQTIITCTGIKRNIFDILKPNKIFKVSNNQIKEINGKF